MSSMYDNMTIDSSYWNTVHSELSNYNNLNQQNFYTKGYRVVYLVRLWCRRNDTYVYKVGSTENLTQRVKQLNNTYDSCGRIIIVAAGIVSSLYDESLMHQKLDSYRLDDSFQLFHNDREIYELNYDVYDMFISMLYEHLEEPLRFVSEDYTFQTDGDEFMQVDDYDMLLDCDDIEIEYWNYRRDM